MGEWHYEFPYEIIKSSSRSVWANLSKPATAILPILGWHMNRDTKESFPGMERLCRVSGYKDPHKVREGIYNLWAAGLIEKGRKDGHNMYWLKGKAVYHEGKGSYVPFTEEMYNRWAELKPCEQRVFMVLLGKATIIENHYGHIKVKKLRELAGISYMSPYSAFWGLYKGGWIGFDNEEISFEGTGEIWYKIDDSVIC